MQGRGAKCEVPCLAWADPVTTQVETQEQVVDICGQPRSGMALTHSAWSAEYLPPSQMLARRP